MDNKSTEVLLLGSKVKKAIEEDWNEQRRKGERYSAWSRSRFDQQLRDKRPKIGTSGYLKKILEYTHATTSEPTGPDRKLDTKSVSVLLDYLYNEIKTESAWPRVNQVFRNYMGGKYMPLLRPHLSDVLLGDAQKLFSEEDMVKAGATPHESRWIQFLELADKLKKKSIDMEDETRSTQELNKILKQRLSVLNQRITKLEDLAKRSKNNDKELEEAIKSLKKAAK